MSEEFDMIVVGSGAGGAPLAARLAEYGFSVLVLEAGPRHDHLPPDHPVNEVTEVPAFHGVSTEAPEISWAFSVEHFADPPKPDDSKRNKNGFDGIFYPRATGIGGCTIHNAMITILGPDSDWDAIASLVGDESWAAERMHAYFERLERCQYQERPRGVPESNGWKRLRADLLRLIGRASDPGAGGHGFDGWLATSTSDFTLGLKDKQLLKVLVGAVIQSASRGLDDPTKLVKTILRGQLDDAIDPNHRRTMTKSPAGVVVIPTAIHGPSDGARRGHRSGPRERLLAAEERSKSGRIAGKLEIRTDCLVERVILDEEDGRLVARGVEYRRGRALYRAVPGASGAGEAESHTVLARCEVVLSGGAFNTPQLLMLSGIGEREHLEDLGIDCRVHRPGVGRNLQDRYEVTVVSQMKSDFSLVDGATFALPAAGQEPDRHLAGWRRDGSGIYATNGAVLGIFKRSRPDLPKPDLFIFGIPLPFRGYELGYSQVGDVHDQFTWAILKSHTRNRDGRVRLRSSDPRDTPLINFHSFEELSRNGRPVPPDDPDMAALVDGVEFVRGIADHADLVIERELHPGRAEIPVGDDDALRAWIEREAWGHHASCTCRIGRPDDELAVVDHQLRVLGPAGASGRAAPVDHLRVVDASIFPTIPGYFIVSNIYMASEKAADVIAEAHR